jgi:erythromycin esterase-like protein
MDATVTCAAIEEHAHAFTGERGDYEVLLDLVGDRRFVLIGEASHGTHDFYTERARITRLKGTRMSIAPLDHVLSASRSFDL